MYTIFYIIAVEDKYADLPELQKVLLDLQVSVFSFESAASFMADYIDNSCDAVPENLCFWGICVTNFSKALCYFARAFVIVIQHVVRLGLAIALQSVNRNYEIATLGPDRAAIAADWTEAIYKDMTAFNEWNYEALTSINDVIQVQHTSMRQHLQDRHFAMEK
jgi:hypothetical protein